MKRTTWLLVIIGLIGLLVWPLMAAAQDETECDIAYLFNGWARASAEGAPNGAVFGLLVKLGGEEDTLVGASSDVAAAVELHEMVMGDNDVMQMRPVEGGFVLPPDRYLELAPGGYHIMLIGLRQPLVAGETLDLTLHFERAGDIPITVPIRDMTTMEGGEQMADEMTMQPMPAMDWGEACAGLHVVGAWARAAAAGMPNSAAYALVLNLTDQDDTLIAASSNAAGAVELHQMVTGDNDVMQMRPVEGGIVVPAGGAALLKPGGFHIMMIGLTEALTAGDTIEITLTFAESGEVTLTVPVKEPEED